MKHIPQDVLLDAVRQACREETFGLTALGEHITTDYDAAHNGAFTSRIAQLVEARPNTVLRRLHKLHQNGVLIRIGKQRRAYRWWPFNLLAERQF